MKVLLHKIARSEDGLIELSVSYGEEPAKWYKATYDSDNSTYTFCRVDHELFMMLSDLAYKRFGNCAVYQMELCFIIRAFCNCEPLPNLPAELGTTAFCSLRPGLLRIFWNKFIIFLTKIGVYRPSIWINPEYKNSF